MSKLEENMTPIGMRIDKALKHRGMTKQELLRRSGISNSTLYNVMTDEARDPRIYTIRVIADALNVSIDWLVGRSRS